MIVSLNSLSNKLLIYVFLGSFFFSGDFFCCYSFIWDVCSSAFSFCLTIYVCLCELDKVTLSVLKKKHSLCRLCVLDGFGRLKVCKASGTLACRARVTPGGKAGCTYDTPLILLAHFVGGLNGLRLWVGKVLHWPCRQARTLGQSSNPPLAGGGDVNSGAHRPLSLENSQSPGSSRGSQPSLYSFSSLYRNWFYEVISV